ncbi:AbrB/MazE/SpoVT family DNA-binding domain-containing protein, partial [Mycobacterium tuberculosis]
MNKPDSQTRQLKLIKIGNSAGVILPRDILDRLGVTVGDSLSVHNTRDGIVLAARDEQFEHQMAEA